LVAERAAFLALVAGGVGTLEASRSVGVDPRTGRRWLHGRSDRVGAAGLPAVPAASARFLTVGERVVIADLVLAKVSLRSIAAGLGRSVSTVSREIARNGHPETGSYRPYAADQRAAARRARPRGGKIAADPLLRAAVQGMLEEKLSPEQIAGRLRRDHPDQPEYHVSHETIYQALYVQGKGELRRELVGALRTGRAVRRPRNRPHPTRRSGLPKPLVMISERPAEAADRAVPGHWEGDLIIGTGARSAIGTLVERTTRYVLLVHLPDDHTAATVRDGLIHAVSTLPGHLRRSLTWDQGTEMAKHKEFTLATSMQVYFCDPHSPWQRGTNENTNGLLRQYFPKSTNLSVHTPEDLAAVAAQLNRRPRKTLDWDTPAERLATLINTSQ
jgi:IS30 family transposase